MSRGVQTSSKIQMKTWSFDRLLILGWKNQKDVGSGRTALAAVASQPAAVDAVFPAPAGSRSVRDAPEHWCVLYPKDILRAVSVDAF